jgi:hypothetical protein
VYAWLEKAPKVERQDERVEVMHHPIRHAAGDAVLLELELRRALSIHARLELDCERLAVTVWRAGEDDPVSDTGENAFRGESHSLVPLGSLVWYVEGNRVVAEADREELGRRSLELAFGILPGFLVSHGFDLCLSQVGAV